MASSIPLILMAAGTGLGVAGTIAEGRERSKQFEYEAQQKQREKAQMLSRQRALYAKSGVVISEGSPLEVQADTATQYEMDIRRKRQQAKYAKTTSYFKAGSTLLTGMSGMFGSFGAASSNPLAKVTAPAGDYRMSTFTYKG
jgi:hypothetical protein